MIIVYGGWWINTKKSFLLWFLNPAAEDFWHSWGKSLTGSAVTGCSSSCAAGEEDGNTKVVKAAVVFWKPLGDTFSVCYLKSWGSWQTHDLRQELINNPVIAISVFIHSKFLSELQNSQFKPAGQGVSPWSLLLWQLWQRSPRARALLKLTGGHCPCWHPGKWSPTSPTSLPSAAGPDPLGRVWQLTPSC